MHQEESLNASKKQSARPEIAEILRRRIDDIMNEWERRIHLAIESTRGKESIALKDSLPEYLSLLADALSRNRFHILPEKQDLQDSKDVGSKHGQARAESPNYTIEELIYEYHILRQVIFESIEEEMIINSQEREIITGSIEQAVNDAAAQFSNLLRNFQDQLSFSLVHDLRSQISIAKLSSELILKKPAEMNNCIDKARRIVMSMDKLDKMIIDLLDATKTKAGQILTPEFKECDLDAIVRSVAKEIDFVEEGRVIVESTGKCIGYWNENYLIRMVENLTSNAIKYGQENAPITIKLNQSNDHITLEVHNEGRPISSEEQAALFQHFKRARSTERKTGWGIGLFIVKGMVNAHKGTIKVESEKDKGTSFIIKLPNDPRKKLH